jgi:glucoamylase
VCFDRIEPAFQRYVANPVRSLHEIWSFRHPLRHVPRGKTLRIVVSADATVHWSSDGWQNTLSGEAIKNDSLKLWFVDLPTATLDGEIEFTFFWKDAARWEGRNFPVEVGVEISS